MPYGALTEQWTTIAATPMPGWVLVRERRDPDDEGHLLYTDPCGALLVQHRNVGDEIESRTIAADFVGAQAHAADGLREAFGVIETATWEECRPRLEREAAETRERIRIGILSAIRHSDSQCVSDRDLMAILRVSEEQFHYVLGHLEDECVVKVAIEEGRNLDLYIRLLDNPCLGHTGKEHPA